MEQWRDIPGYEGRYQVSDMGCVRSLGRWAKCGKNGVGSRWIWGRVLRPGRQPSGHLTVAVGKGNSIGVHRAVMLAFNGPPPAGQ